MSNIDRYGCGWCFAAVTDPTPDEDERGTCDDCHRRDMARAVDEWRAFEDLHADVLTQD